VDNDPVEKIRAVRSKLATDGPIRVRSGGDFERVSIGRSDGDVLRDLLLAERACTVIEIGLAYGGSALAIAEALVANGSGQGRHLIIDAYQNSFYGSGWSAIVEAGIADLCFGSTITSIAPPIYRMSVRGDSQSALNAVTKYVLNPRPLRTNRQHQSRRTGIFFPSRNLRTNFDYAARLRVASRALF